MRIYQKIIKYLKLHRVQIFVLAIALVWKLIWLLLNTFPFNSDEAVVGLMARHILQGERPLFFYGQYYMGSLDAYLVALGFGIFGVKIWVIRALQIILYLATILMVMGIAKKIFQNELITLIVGLLLAIPTVNIHLYTTVSLGGYGEAMFFGSLIVFLWINAESLLRVDQVPKVKIFLVISAIGFLIGLGIWLNALTLVFGIPVMIAFFMTIVKRKTRHLRLKLLFLFCFAFLIGLFPFWIAAAKSGLQIFIQEMLGSAVSVEKANWIGKIAAHLRNFLLLGIPVIIGIRPPWAVIWLVLPLIPPVLFIWIYSFAKLKWLILNQKEIKQDIWLLIGIVITLVIGFIFTSFGVDPSGRYFIPLALPFAILFSAIVVFGIKNTKVRWLVISVLLLYNALSTLQCGIKRNPGFTTQFYEPSVIDHSYDQELIQFLQDDHATRGYTNYWVSYPLAFLSDEQIIFIPSLPYHLDLTYTERDNRYEPYNEIVNQSDSVAYITTRNPELDKKIEKAFQLEGIQWSEKRIGDYHIYYKIDRKVRPIELGLIAEKLP